MLFIRNYLFSHFFNKQSTYFLCIFISGLHKNTSRPLGGIHKIFRIYWIQAMSILIIHYSTNRCCWSKDYCVSSSNIYDRDWLYWLELVYTYHWCWCWRYRPDKFAKSTIYLWFILNEHKNYSKIGIDPLEYQNEDGHMHRNYKRLTDLKNRYNHLKASILFLATFTK